ncbi:unnamed protein product [Caenorhabditis brenneri]
MKTFSLLLLITFIGYTHAARCVTVYEKPEGFVWWFEPTDKTDANADIVKNVGLIDCKLQVAGNPVFGSGIWVQASRFDKIGDCHRYRMEKGKQIPVNFSTRIASFIVKYDSNGICDMKDLNGVMDGKFRPVPESNPPRRLAIVKDPTYYNILLKYE